MGESFPSDNVCHHDKLLLTAMKSAADNSDDQGPCAEYLKQYKSFVEQKLWGSLDGIIATMEGWREDGCGLGLPGSELSEMLHHSDWARKKCETFVGRDALVSELFRSMTSPDNPMSREGKLSDDFDGITACVVGVSGAGKTALMAKVASMMYKQHESQGSVMVPVLIRFCGTSAGSATARDLMANLCQQIEFLFESKDRRGSKLRDEPYETLTAYFQQLLSEHAVCLFIGSLDQLSDADSGRSQISFLKGVRPHKDTRIVVSCLPDDKEGNPETNTKYLYWCETRLAEHKVPRVMVQMPSDVLKSVDESITILDALLNSRNRRLSDDQRKVLRNRVEQERQKTALYIHLLVGVVCHLRSDEDAAKIVPEGGVHALIMQMYESLASVYGAHLVRLLLGFLVFSQKGVSQVELEDLLSLNADLMNCDKDMDDAKKAMSVFQFHRDVKVKRVPSHVVVRVLNSLGDLVIAGEHGCLQLYHRQLKEVAQKWLQSQVGVDYKHIVCGHLARYFGGLVSGQEAEQKRLSRQTWTKDGDKLSPFNETSMVNVRRCVEAARAMMACNMFDEAEAELCCFESVCCRFRCGEAFSMMSDLIELVDERPSPETRTDHYLRWLRRDTHMLLRSPIRRLLTSASDQPTISEVYKDAAKMIPNMNEISPQLQYGRKFENNREGFDALLFILRTGDIRDPFYSVCYSPDSGQLVTRSDRSVDSWDAKTGAHLLTLAKSSYEAYSVCFSHDGSCVASGSSDGDIFISDAESGALANKLSDPALASEVKSLSYRPNSSSQYLAAGLDNGMVFEWDLKTGASKLLCQHQNRGVRNLCYSPEGTCLASVYDNGALCIWDANNGSLVHRLDENTPCGLFTACCYSRDGLQLASGSGDGTVRIWDLEPKPSGDYLCIRELKGHSDVISSICYSPKRPHLASASYDSTIRIWSTEKAECLQVFRGHSGPCMSICYDTDVDRLASASGDSTVRIWDATITGISLPVLEGHTGKVDSVCFSPNGANVASASDYDGTIRVWDVASGALSWKCEAEGVESVCYSMDGSRLAYG
jgi:WD40 repeat protein